MPLTLADLKSELRVDLPIDPWGHAMGAWFDTASELHNRNASIPEHWHFSPAATTDDQEVTDFWSEVFATTDNDTLRQFGNLLERYTNHLRRAGMDY